MSIAIEIDRGQIAAFCRKWRITELSLFGSVLREDFRPDSDVDVLVTFASGVKLTLRSFSEMRQELRNILGRDADLVERKAVEQGPNYIRRRHILANLETLYEGR